MRVCNGCKREKPEVAFYERKTGSKHICKECQQQTARNYYWDNREKLLSEQKERKRANQALVWKLKEAPCVDCRGVFPPEAMDFDHVRGIKFKSISDLLHFTRERMLEEIEKCELVCANCHRVRSKQRQNNVTIEGVN